MRITRIIALGLSLGLIAATAAHAGRLFPPANVGTAPECAGGMVLKWSGNSVICENPSPGVSITACASGQVMTGISNGVPVCVTPTISTSSLTVSCPSGQVLTGLNKGAAVCSTPSTAAVTLSCPTGQVLTGVSSGSPVCTVSTNPSYQFGGYFSTDDYRAFAYSQPMIGSCNLANPLTGGCSCPSGFHATRLSYSHLHSMMHPNLIQGSLFMCIKS